MCGSAGFIVVSQGGKGVKREGRASHRRTPVNGLPVKDPEMCVLICMTKAGVRLTTWGTRGRRGEGRRADHDDPSSRSPLVDAAETRESGAGGDCVINDRKLRTMF